MEDFMEKTENSNILGTEKISKLMFKFSVPCILSLLIGALYNIVDQIFIGQGVGLLGNAATNIAFPVSIICTAAGIVAIGFALKELRAMDEIA